jgi:hypothetical protein
MSHKTAVLFGLAALMIIWPVFIEWLRHRSFKKSQGTGFSPGTQHLAIIGTAGMAILIIVSLCVVAYYVFRG